MAGSNHHWPGRQGQGSRERARRSSARWRASVARSTRKCTQPDDAVRIGRRSPVERDSRTFQLALHGEIADRKPLATAPHRIMPNRSHVFALPRPSKTARLHRVQGFNMRAMRVINQQIGAKPNHLHSWHNEISATTASSWRQRDLSLRALPDPQSTSRRALGAAKNKSCAQDLVVGTAIDQRSLRRGNVEAPRERPGTSPCSSRLPHRRSG